MGAVDAIMHEVNAAYGLGLPNRDVNPGNVRAALGNTSSPAFDLFIQTRQDQSTWLAQAVRWRNNGAHKGRVGKKLGARVTIMDGQVVDREAGQPDTSTFGEQTLTNRDGRYLHSGMKPGRYFVFVQVLGNRSVGRVELTLKQSEAAKRDFKLKRIR